MHAFAFSRDGRYLVTASQDHTARAWEVDKGRDVVRIPHGDIVVAATISQDGEWLGSTGYDRLAKISPLRPESLVRQACARLTRDLSPAEWAQYLPGEPYRTLCPPQ